MSYAAKYLEVACAIAQKIDLEQIEKMIATILDVRAKGGRLFFIGVGGSAANCSHAVNDFRKIAGIECYAPVDNVAELTARTNDEGWESVFTGYLRVSKLNAKDALMVLSVGGGDRERNISPNIVAALELAKERGARIMGIVGRNGGHTAQVADACIIIPTISDDMITPQAEGWQGMIWHMLVSDPRILLNANKWESQVPAIEGARAAGKSSAVFAEN